MSTRSKIEWTDRTWNPVRGCSEVSEGCRNCYAMRQAKHVDDMFGATGRPKPYDGTWRMTERGPVWTGKVRLVESELDAPLRWRKPSRVFVNSMSDLFHESVPENFIDKVFAVMALTPRHTYQILTKRPERMREYLSDLNYRKEQVGVEAELTSGFDRSATASPANVMWPLSNVHLGVSVEKQPTADERIPLLFHTPAAVRFLSVEPLLGPLDLSAFLYRCPECGEPPSCNSRWRRAERPQHHHGYPVGHVDADVQTNLHWVIVGGESGPGARPCNVEGIRSIVRQCQAAGVPVFVKQLGSVPCLTQNGRAPGEIHSHTEVLKLRDRKGGDPAEWPEDFPREFPR